MSPVPVLVLAGRVTVLAEGERWSLPPLTVRSGEWLALRPGEGRPAAEASLAIARLLATLAFPASGTVELFGRDPATLPYLVLQQLRFRLALVQAWGGLLSNRTVAENLALPLRVRESLDGAGVDREVASAIERYGIAEVAERRPHGLDAATAFRVRAARALVGRPELTVVEGIGDWESGRRGSRTWDLLGEASARDGAAFVVCLPAAHPEFETWFAGRGGRIEAFTRDPRVPGGVERSSEA